VHRLTGIYPELARAAPSFCGRDSIIPAVRNGEEAEVFGGPRGQVLREQGCSSCQEEALTARQGENSQATSSWR
jgi:hypothetical protein